MKKTLTFLVLIFAFLVGITSCEDRNPLEQCQTSSSACGSFKACCTAIKCYYEYDGRKFNCDGLDCTDAATALANVMCNTSGVKGVPCITAEEILAALPCTVY